MLLGTYQRDAMTEAAGLQVRGGRWASVAGAEERQVDTV